MISAVDGTAELMRSRLRRGPAGGKERQRFAWSRSLLRPPVHGRALDAQTRCAHWHSPLDIIAIKMRCCGAYYACRECHDELAGHETQVGAGGAFERPRSA